MFVLIALFPIVVDEDATHPQIGQYWWVFFLKESGGKQCGPPNVILESHRIFQQCIVAGILQTQICSFVEAFTNVSTFPDLPASPILFLLRRTDFIELQFNVGRELYRRTME